MTSRHFEGEDLETRVRQLEDAIALLKADPTLRDLPYGTLKEAKSHLALRSIGGTSGGHYAAGVLNANYGVGTGALLADYLYALPFYLPGAPNTVAEMGVRVIAGSAGTNFRLGIYADKGEPMLYPHKLLLDAGEIGASTGGVKSLTVKQGLPRGLVWVAVLVESAVPTIRIILNNSAFWALLGSDDATDTRYNAYRVGQAYGTLPDPFPASALERGDSFPYVYLKFS